MIGLGTIINCGSVLAGASAGMLLKNGLSKRFEDTIMQGIGLCTMFIGIGGALSGLLTLENGQLATQHTMLLILSLALGALIGAGISQGAGKLVNVAMPFAVTWLLANLQPSVIYFAIVGIALVAAIVVIAVGPETRAKRLG